MTDENKAFGRPPGTGKYGGESISKTFRLSEKTADWISLKGGRAYLESLTPKDIAHSVIKKQLEAKKQRAAERALKDKTKKLVQKVGKTPKK